MTVPEVDRRRRTAPAGATARSVNVSGRSDDWHSHPSGFRRAVPTAGVNVLGDVVARDRRSDAIAVRTASRAGSYSYEKFCTQAWKAGNLLRHYGVRTGATVGVVTEETLSPPPLVAAFGTALLGATVAFDPGPVDARALVVPGGRADGFDPDPGTQVLAYGDESEDPTIANFEREVWSENPTMPPDSVSAGTDALVADGERFTHERLLAAARGVVDDAGLDSETVVVPRAPLADPGAFVAGVLAPLVAGATVGVGETTGDVGVGNGVPEARAIDPAGAF